MSIRTNSKPNTYSKEPKSKYFDPLNTGTYFKECGHFFKD